MKLTAEQYIEQIFPHDADLARVTASLKANGMPEISVPPGYGRLLTMLAALAGGESALEIGALGGYSGICICRGLRENGKLISLELSPEFAETAKQNIREAGFGGMVELRVGEALASLAALANENQRFDLIFIDADKGNYPLYLEWAIRLSHPGTVIAGDNALLHGRTMDPEEDGPSVIAIREFNEKMATDPRLISAIIPAYDGMAVGVVKPF
ncbi:MAG TPA: O-methyltransferase [Bacilli bacterium]